MPRLTNRLNLSFIPGGRGGVEDGKEGEEGTHCAVYKSNGLVKEKEAVSSWPEPRLWLGINSKRKADASCLPTLLFPSRSLGPSTKTEPFVYKEELRCGCQVCIIGTC